MRAWSARVHLSLAVLILLGVPTQALLEAKGVDPYGTDPTIIEGTRADVCRGGAVANRDGRRALSDFVARKWPKVADIGGYECREIGTLPSNPDCDGEVAPAFSTCWSTHAAGRAIDVFVGGESSLPTRDGVVLGDRIATFFLRKRDGVPHYFARVTGVQEIFWNGRCWHTDDRDVVRAAQMDPCGIPNHDNHVHLTLSNDGADGQTSWYESSLARS